MKERQTFKRPLLTELKKQRGLWLFVRIYQSLGKTPNIHMPSFAHTHTHTCGSMERWMGGVRAGCMPPLLKDSERGGREGSEMRLDTLCCSAGELCLFSLERSSTWDRSHTAVTHSSARSATNCSASPTAGVAPQTCTPTSHQTTVTSLSLVGERGVFSQITVCCVFPYLHIVS